MGPKGFKAGLRGLVSKKKNITVNGNSSKDDCTTPSSKQLGKAQHNPMEKLTVKFIRLRGRG